MDTAQRNTRCPVYLHPASASNPDAVRTVQQATGQLVVITGGMAQLRKPEPTFIFVSGTTDCLADTCENRRYFIIDEVPPGPFGGDAA